MSRKEQVWSRIGCWQFVWQSTKDDGVAQGFTIIELVMVIILMGILSAFAMTRYVDLHGQAKRAVNEDIFRKFAEQMDKAHILYEIKKNQEPE